MRQRDARGRRVGHVPEGEPVRGVAAALVAGALALGIVTLAPMANAGERRLNPDRCPDIREDWRDMRRDNGWRDRREDRRDYRVINCPARA